jgi:hypothetical protein
VQACLHLPWPQRLADDRIGEGDRRETPGPDVASNGPAGQARVRGNAERSGYLISEFAMASWA